MKILATTQALAIGAIFATAMTSAAMAASVTNNDAEQVIITVTEEGERTEIEIEPGRKLEMCLSGCFVSFPSGGMLALKGEEEVIVEQGEGKISGE